MYKSKIWPTLLMLSSAILVFLLLLIYLNILLFRLKKEKIEVESQNLVSQSFFSTLYNEKGLHIYVDELLEQEINQVPIEQMRSRLQNIFKDYDTISAKIDTVFSQMELAVDYEWTISTPRFEIRNAEKTIALVDSKNKRAAELVLYGKDVISPDATQYLFYKIGDNYFNQINLYIEFTNIYTVIAKQMILVIVIDIFLVFLFAAIMRHSIKTLLRQHNIVTLQTDLLNAVSHEFNTPLSAIQIGSQTLLKLEERADSNVISEIAHGIIRKQKYLKNLVDRILTLGISESKGITPDIDIYNADELINDIVKKWMEDKNVAAVHFEIGDLPDCQVNIDPHLLKLTLFNILDNALKYADKEPVTINLWGIQVGKRIKIFIKDNGPGMSVSDLKNVFKKFYRGEHSKNSKRGLGLGLYLVKQILKIHNGTCQIKSNKDEGTTVIITLPLYYE
ncbi:hypothetical protein GTQ40_13525 [Flavobacteriaceae bacterium R38]|nr:hypothetical protein [Flavobacteriaceae bacterium R38]